MAAMGAAADGGGGGGGKRAEGRGSQMKGDESASASTNDEGSDNFYSLFGLSVGASADEIKVQCPCSFSCACARMVP